ncbi:MAG: hypothetical protein COZ06_20980 [Armatimonadetes bacterium CG_4_10_14_3_um_filter_66_18]|nr:hypothetical protein [Armatimonadota bacterium]OIP03070.1 MAG: hypothetical protein AUJ96_15230 [Armatimonadetes bacterium CG2_30_66_41]PIU95043.1 MAG: hypothetical protein COS65_04490 [Armatimonadetes bacterium CG06_land_8_20_14_3_00_66_21]PIX40688.1 MAG: hypothetical protein COZ57_25290 [Armatimonadetes bacterium CG_4_8_14_3_um_filter_66_20]PIY44261.1 MAG: hypothetical protein COZ06_20980 [Armatimonadetes bacterium CG_4_10_14_3_um_filter_66_18]PIZ33247.1 MAG: hypothetical protein COY42_30
MPAAHAVLNRLLDPVGRCFTLEVAQRITELRAPKYAQRRIEELAAKSTAGTLSENERGEYDAYVSAGSFVAILQTKARRLLREAQRH